MTVHGNAVCKNLMLVVITSLFTVYALNAKATNSKKTFYFSMPQQRADVSLNQIAEQANITLIFPFETMLLKKANAIDGVYTAENALAKALYGTGFNIVPRNDGHISIIPKPNEGEQIIQLHNEIAALVMQTVALNSGTSSAITQEASVPLLEEIIATGIRGSIKQGLIKKEIANSIVDGAFAEELGKFPDANVAESLQRITGLAITRSRGGEGQFVTVRGLGEEFNAVTYNGRILATENQGREFPFDVIASDLISAAEIYKSTMASQGDGSIGGLVNIRSALPLDNPGFHGVGKLATQYESLGNSFGERVSAVISNTWADNTLGMLLAVSHQQRDTRTDVAESIFVDTDAGDQNGDGVADRLNSFSASVAFQERQRTGGTVALQYQPNDKTDLVLDALYTNFQSPSRLHGYSFFPSQDALAADSVVVSDNNVIINQATAGATLDLLTRFNEADANTLAFGGKLKQQWSDRLLTTIDLAWSNAEGQRDNVGSADGSGKFFVLSVPNSDFSQSPGGAVPNINFTAGNGLGFQVPFSQISVNQPQLSFSRNTFIETTDKVLSTKIDFEYAVNDTSSIEFGLDYVNRKKSNQAFDNRATWCGDSTTIVICGTGNPLSNFVDLGDELTVFNDGFLNSGGGNVPGSIPIISVQTVTSAFDNISARFGVPSFLTVTPNLAASNVIEERVLGAYTQINFAGDLAGMPYYANAGFRIAQTNLTSTGVDAEITSAVFELSNIALDPIQTFEVSPTTSIVAKNDYFDLLPAFNIAVDISEKSKLRGAFSQTLTRPTLTDLATFFSVPSQNFGAEQISKSNPFLEPVRSDNVDLSFEYYGINGLSYSITGFYKEVSNFITNRNSRQSITVDDVRDTSGNPVNSITRNFTVSEPRNGDSAKIYGAELALQYLAESGFGFSANITLASSSATSLGEDSALENISDVSANASVFYEANNIQARFSVNHRSDYLVSTEGESGLAEFVDDYTQVDLSLGYNLGNAFGGERDLFLFFEGANVFDEPFFRYAETSDLLEAYEINGVRWSFGLRGSL